jgi:hypothetical protein
MGRRPALLPAVAVAALLVAGCSEADGEAPAGDPDSGEHAEAADTSTCVADATPVGSTPDGYPADFPMPDGTVVFAVEDRGEDGVIATGVTRSPFEDVLAAMNAAEKAGFRVTSGETEDDDAEANWTGNGYVGRWAIKKSATCPGETVVQLLSKQT